MNQNVVCVGIDVDDVQVHGSALDRQTGEVLSFQCRLRLNGTIRQLEDVRIYFGGAPQRIVTKHRTLVSHDNVICVTYRAVGEQRGQENNERTTRTHLATS